MTEIKKPKYLKPNRTSKRDLEISNRVNNTLAKVGLWSFDPPVSTIACFQKGLLFTATSTNNLYVLVPLNYVSSPAARRRLDAAQKALEGAGGYSVMRDGDWLIIRPD